MQKFSFTGSGNAQGTAILGVSLALAVSYKSNNTLIVRSRSDSPQASSVENLGPHQNLHVNIYSSFIHHCQNLEATKMSFNK